MCIDYLRLNETVYLLGKYIYNNIIYVISLSVAWLGVNYTPSINPELYTDGYFGEITDNVYHSLTQSYCYRIDSGMAFHLPLSVLCHWWIIYIYIILPVLI